MDFRVPEIHPISDLARYARALVEKARQLQQPIVITQRGREMAVLVPIELYRRMEKRRPYQMASPRLINREDARQMRMEVTILQPPPGCDADVRE